MKQDGSRFILENEALRVTVERSGAQLTSIFDKEKNREVLWRGDPAIWDRCAPVLFPFVGKSFGGTYRYQEKTYQIPAHGFARDMEFEPVLCDMDECWYKLKDTPQTLAMYPFHFEVEIGHRLEGRTITVMWRVTNTDSGEMLFMMGGHPAFQVPEGKTIYDYTFVFNQEGICAGQHQEGLHYQAPDSDGYREESRSGELALEKGQVRLTKGFFDKALTYIFDDAQISSVGLLVDGEPYVTVKCDQFPYLGVWTMEKTHPFVCLEPWYGVCDKKDYDGELKDRDGVVALPGWQSWEKSYSIIIA